MNLYVTAIHYNGSINVDVAIYLKATSK